MRTYEFPQPCWDIGQCCHHSGILFVVILLKFHEYSFPVMAVQCFIARDILIYGFSNLSDPSSIIFHGKHASIFNICLTMNFKEGEMLKKCSLSRKIR